MREPDHIKGAIEAKILDAIDSRKWKTLAVTTTIDTRGIVVQAKVGEKVTEYVITVKRKGRQ